MCTIGHVSFMYTTAAAAAAAMYSTLHTLLYSWRPHRIRACLSVYCGMGAVDSKSIDLDSSIQFLFFPDWK